MRLRPSRRLAVLDFDLENRPLSYLSSDWTSAEITAIGWSWVGTEVVETLMLQRTGTFEDSSGKRLSAPKALSVFCRELRSAGLITGHYIRKHDLPILQGNLLEFALPPLEAMLTQDTQQDLVRRKDMSASQANLAAMYGLDEEKHMMTQAAWRRSNRLSREGIEEARKRVVDDVVQHKALRERLLEGQALKAPRVWYP